MASMAYMDKRFIRAIGHPQRRWEAISIQDLTAQIHPEVLMGGAGGIV